MSVEICNIQIHGALECSNVSKVPPGTAQTLLLSYQVNEYIYTYPEGLET